MVTSKLSKEDIFSRGNDLSFPESVKSMFRGDLGQPHGGWPKDLQRIILKDEKPYTDLPNAHLKPVDFDAEFEIFQNKFDRYLSFLDFLSWKFYPKVFEDYYDFKKQFGEVYTLPTPTFFFGMKSNEEIMVTIGPGKTVLIRLLFVSEHSDEMGNRAVFFRLNGQTRAIEIKDRKAKIKKSMNLKASGDKQIGTPLQGRLSKIFVKPGEKLSKNSPLFTIEAMKMETTITASKDLIVKKVILEEASMVESDDLVIEVE